jgi:hypothetical protein
MWKWLKNNHHSVTSLAAIAVSVIALFVAWDQANVMPAQQHAEVWPALPIESRLDTAEAKWSKDLKVTNDGIGPAIVESVTAAKEETTLTTWEDLAQFISPEVETGLFTGYSQREILAPGESALLARPSWDNPSDEEKTIIREFLSRFWTMDLNICFCSVYDQCWSEKYNSTASKPRPVDSCPVRQENSYL